MTDTRPSHLAWHETLEMHELVVMQSVALKKLKAFGGQVQDNMLKQLYIQTLSDLEQNLGDLVAVYPKAPREQEAVVETSLDDAFFALELLSLSKQLVRQYAWAITETASPSLKDTFSRHLNKSMMCHTKVFNYMHQNGLYPAYQLDRLLEEDVELANNALQ